jgi:hypothetical protein
MEITNFDLEAKGKPHHHWLLPSSIRCVICGPSGCGKTNLLLNLLMKKGYLNFDRMHLYSKSLGQEKYQFLRDWAQVLEGVAGKEVASFHSSSDDIVPVETLDKKEWSIMVFDDVMLEKQTPIEKYFCQGRHGGADCFYLTQNYFRIPKQAIRDNCNLLILFNQDAKNMRAIHDTFVGGDMDFNEFRKFCSECWAQPYGFCVIDLTSEVYNGKYRCGFDRFYTPKSSI